MLCSPLLGLVINMVRTRSGPAPLPEPSSPDIINVWQRSDSPGQGVDLQKLLGMEVIKTWSVAGMKGRGIKHDGNCGHETTQKNLASLNIQHKSSMTAFRKDLHDHVVQRSGANPPLCDTITTLDGRPVEQ